MIIFLISVSYLFNPYIILLVISNINIKTYKIYFYITFLLYFLFFNTRIYNNFIYVQGGAAADDSGDYIRASELISNFSIFEILTAKADASINHIDKAFGLLQLLLSKLFPPEIIPFVFSFIFGILFLSILFTFPKVTNGLIKINPKLLGSLVLLNPYIIYVNQHLFRQGIAIAFILTAVIPFIFKKFIKDEYLKLNKYDYILLIISLAISFGLHRGSSIVVIGILITSFLISLNSFNDIAGLLFKFVLKKRTLFFIISIFIFYVLITYSNKYYDQLLKFILNFNLRIKSDLGSTGIRTGYFGLLFSLYGLYSWKVYKLSDIFKKNFKTFNLSLSLINTFISLIVIISSISIPRILFSTNIILLTFTLISYKINILYLRLLTLSIGILTFSSYIFVKEGFWGKGDHLFPYI